MKKIYYLTVLAFLSLSNTIIKADPIDSLFIELPTTGFGENLDILLNQWYVQQSLKFEDSDSLLFFDEGTDFPDFPDSVYIARLQSLPFIMDLSYNGIVRNFIHLYTKERRDRVRIMLTLTHYYFPIFEEIFDRHGIPDELKYLAVIESALNPRAVSRVGATGLWQFMPATGKSYGLVVNSLIDDRRDVLKSTEAAARFMKDLYRIYNDWTLVIAAYNCGPGNVNKAIRRAGGKRNYWEIYYFLPRETRGYVPAFIAASYVMNFHEEHNLFPVPLDFEMHTDTIQINQRLHLKQVADVLGVPLQQLRDLNPQYRHDIIPGDGRTYHLRIPQLQVMNFIDLQDSILAYRRDELIINNQIIVNPASSSSFKPPVLPSDRYTRFVYTVKSGDNLGFISTWYNVTINDLRHWNNIRGNLIRSGQQLVVYVPNERAERYKEINQMSFAEKQRRAGIALVESPSASAPSASAPSINDGEYIYYTVRSGDTLWEIARKYPGISYNEIASLNNIKQGERIQPGQVLKIKK